MHIVKILRGLRDKEIFSKVTGVARTNQFTHKAIPHWLLQKRSEILPMSGPTRRFRSF